MLAHTGPRLFCVLYLSDQARLLRPIEDTCQQVRALVVARGSATRPHACDLLYVLASDADLLAEENHVWRQHGLDALQSKSSDWSYLRLSSDLVTYAER